VTPLAPTDRLEGWQATQGAAPATLARMAHNIRESLRSPSVVETARGIIAGVAPRDCVAQARAIRAWVDKRFRFVRDPLGVELLEAPSFHLSRIRDFGFVQGDCDDAATITAALGMAVGIPATLHAVAFFKPDAPFAHVFTVLHPTPGPKEGVEMDITHQAGKKRPPISREILRRV
jgi:transglutaminase-like putative cysteine protease